MLQLLRDVGPRTTLCLINTSVCCLNKPQHQFDPPLALLFQRTCAVCIIPTGCR